MKKLILLPLAAVLLFSATAAAQNNTQASSTSTKALTILGKVSDDGRTIVGENSTAWSVTNPGTLAGREGHQVKVKCRLYSATHNILVLSVKLADAQSKYAANSGDSAFRR